MQNRLTYSFIALLFILFTFSSCKKSTEAGKIIPKDASFVMIFNGETINNKLSWEEIRNGELFKTMYSDSSVTELAKKALDNPENTGVNIKKDMTAFVVQDTTGGYAAICGTVADATKFKAYFTSLAKDTKASEKNGINFLAKDKGTISWNKDRFIIIVDIPEMKNLNAMANNQWDDSTAMPVQEVYRDGTITAAALYNLSSSASLEKNEKFAELMGKSGDIHFWANAENLNSSSLGGAALSMLNIGKLTEGSIATGVANFEDGKIIVDVKSYSGEELTDIWKKYEGNAINKEMISRSPIKDVAVSFAFNYKPEGLREFLKLTGLEGFANLGAAQVGFTVDDFIKANGGDIFISMGNFSKKDSSSGIKPDFVFASSIKDKPSFDKLISAGNKVFGRGAPADMSYAVSNTYFSLSNSKPMADAYVAGSAKNNFDFIDKISGSPAGGFVNLQYVFTAMKPEVKGEKEIQELNASMAMFENVLFKGGEFKDGGINQHVEINLIDKKTNSLKQLNAYMNQMAILEKKYKQTWDGAVSDTTIALPIDTLK